MLIKFVRRLPSYAVTKSEDPHDHAVLEAIHAHSPASIPSLMTYSRGLYSVDSNYQLFRNFNHSEDNIAKFTYAFKEPLLKQVIDVIHKELRALFSVQALSASNLDSLAWIPDSAAGYGYEEAQKADCYLLTPLLILPTSRRIQLNYSPCRAYARTQQAPRLEPPPPKKTTSSQARTHPLHITLLKGCVAAPILDAFKTYSCPFFIGWNTFVDLQFRRHRTIRESLRILYLLFFL